VTVIAQWMHDCGMRTAAVRIKIYSGHGCMRRKNLVDVTYTIILKFILYFIDSSQYLPGYLLLLLFHNTLYITRGTIQTYSIRPIQNSRIDEISRTLYGIRHVISLLCMINNNNDCNKCQTYNKNAMKYHETNEYIHIGASMISFTAQLGSHYTETRYSHKGMFIYYPPSIIRLYSQY